jgi:hypothetical protein
MRFYLEGEDALGVARDAGKPWVAGVCVPRPDAGSPGSIDRAWDLVLAAADTGRRDWKLWWWLNPAGVGKTVAQAEAATARLSERTGGPLAGPTFVFVLEPTASGLCAASVLAHQGKEVCVGPVGSALAALGCASLPKYLADNRGPGRKGSFRETEGPPGSRNPWAPHYVMVPWERGDSGLVSGVSDALGAYAVRTRILVSGVPDISDLEALVADAASMPGGCPIDVCLPPAVAGRVVE